MSCSCTKARIACTEFCKCVEYCQNTWNMVSENENESENSEDDDINEDDENEWPSRLWDFSVT